MPLPRSIATSRASTTIDSLLEPEDRWNPGLGLRDSLEARGIAASEDRSGPVHQALADAFGQANVPVPSAAAPALPVVAPLADTIEIDAGLSSARGGPGGGGGGGGGGGTSTYTTSVSAYNIRIDFSGTWSVDLQQAFLDSADRLASIIVEDVQDAAIRIKGRVAVVDDISISASLGAIDGVGGILGQAGPTAIRSSGSLDPYLPATATMRFDAADAQSLLAQGSWDEVILHEMLHCVGFGTIWSQLGLVSGSSYVGPAALAAYNAMLPEGTIASGVPLETTGGTGTAGAHWSEAIFGNELMTGYLDSDASAATPDDNALSAMSLAALADLGYGLAADLGSLADPYVLT